MNKEARLNRPPFCFEVAGGGLARPLGPRTEGGLADWARKSRERTTNSPRTEPPSDPTFANLRVPLVHGGDEKGEARGSN
jgi:hypothetical protein